MDFCNEGWGNLGYSGVWPVVGLLSMGTGLHALNLALGLHMRQYQPHFDITRNRFQKPIRKKMWMIHQSVQAKNPDAWIGQNLATAWARPIVFNMPRSV